MNESPNRGLRGHWLPIALLASYWLLLFTGTHVPPEFPGLPPAGYDKIVHFFSFAVLAGLMAIAWRAIWGRLPIWSAMAAWLIVVSYAAGDEITQPWFRRSCDIYDWRADASGAAVGLALVYCWQLLRNARLAKSMPAPQ